MNCEKIQELLSPYIEDELSEERKQEVEKHLQGCASCRMLLVSLKEAREAMGAFPQLEVSERLMSQLYALPHRKKRFKFSFDFLLRPSLQPILAAATIILTLISFYFFNPNKAQIDKSINRQIHLGYSEIERLYAKAETLATNIGEYKNNILVSLLNLNPFGETEE